MKKIALLISSSLFILSNSVLAQTNLSQSEQYLADFLAGKNVANELFIRKAIKSRTSGYYWHLSKMQKKKLGKRNVLYIGGILIDDGPEHKTIASLKDFLNYIKMKNVTISDMKFTPELCDVDRDEDFLHKFGYMGTTLTVSNAKLNNEEFSIIRTIMFMGSSGTQGLGFYFTKDKLNIEKCEDFKKVVDFLGDDLV
ncbi:hypothetical protein [Lonepinella sp. BR2474]|uniref:hypothetical protein n=1 Tax=Lonepinella sp. BR2474 TaxID=3434548 RepID=UPI003F6E31F7